MSNTPLKEFPEISASQSQKETTANQTFRLLDALVQCSVLSIADEPPGSPSDGDMHIVGALSSSASVWSTHEDDIAYYSSSAWTYSTPQVGWIVFDQDQATLLIYRGVVDGWEILDAYDVHGYVDGVPTASQVMLRFPMVRPVKFPDDFSGSQAKSGVAAADSGGAEFVIKKNGTEFGQMSFAQSATTATFNTDSSHEEFGAGDILTVEAPGTPDSALAGVSFTLMGYKI